jgi:hypothetical protein
MAKTVVWVGSYGPDRSHDTLNSAVFERKKDAEDFVRGKKYWRISRLEHKGPYTQANRTDDIGGVDVDRMVEQERQKIQYETGRRATEKEALARWRQLMRSRPGGWGP